MDKEKLIERLLATFLEELEEGVRVLNRNLLALEKAPTPEERGEILKTLFRTAHSLKGASRSVNLTVIEEACHRMEEILSKIRDGLESFTPELLKIFFEAADALEGGAALLRQKKTLEGSDLEGLIPRIAVRGSVAAPVLPEIEAVPPKIQPLRIGENFVRISPEKMDRLMVDSGELLTARRRAEWRNSDLAGLIETLGHWKEEWKVGERYFRKLHSPRAESEEPMKALPKREALILRRVKDRLKDMESGLDRLAKGMEGDFRTLEQTSGLLDEGIRRARMLPFSEACEGLERIVRDMAGVSGKEVEFILKGGEVELDRAIIDKLRDPLFHLIRNAVDHGLEPPGQRIEAGKPAKGKVVVEASLKGNRIEIAVKDDGRGLDLSAVREKALKRGGAEPETERELARLIFTPGFSTSRIVTSFSGRGVGLDVVKSQVESVHGSVDFSFEPGKGTCFIMTAPLTLTTIRALLATAGGQTYAFISSAVEGLLRIDSKDLHVIEGKERVLLNGQALPVATLSELLGVEARETTGSRGKAQSVILSAGDRKAVVVVEEMIAEQEILVKAMGPCLPRLRHFSGATILSTGKIALILNTRNLLKSAFEKNASQGLSFSSAGPASTLRKRLLVVDDSVTTRSLEKSILEGAGYEVWDAADGAEAWRILQEKGADLVVSDVEMPRMDGFTLTEVIRGSQRFRDLPVILVTALESPKDKARGVEAGADAYLLKSAFGQKQLLSVINQLI